MHSTKVDIIDIVWIKSFWHITRAMLQGPSKVREESTWLTCNISWMSCHRWLSGQTSAKSDQHTTHFMISPCTAYIFFLKEVEILLRFLRSALWSVLQSAEWQKIGTGANLLRHQLLNEETLDHTASGLMYSHRGRHTFKISIMHHH